MPAQRVRPAARATLYDQGSEGWALEPGFHFYDIPAHRLVLGDELFHRARKVWAYEPSYRADAFGNYVPSIESIRDISVVCPRPRMVEQDTPTGRYNFFGGSWANNTILEPPRTSRLVQYSSAKNTVYRAESTYFLPQNPNVAFTVQRLQAKYDNNNTSYPAKVEVTIADQWSIRFSNGDDAGIWRKVGGQWKQLKHVELAAKKEEYTVWFIVRRGAVCISFNNGKTWEVGVDTAPITVTSGQLVIEGVSCQISFGFHQLAFDTCYYDSYEVPVLETHLGTPQRDLTYTLIPSGCTITCSFLSSSAGTVKYRLTLAPEDFIVANVDFNMYRVPEVYGVLIYWETIFHAPVGSSVDLVSLGVVDEIDVHEETDPTQRSGRIKIMWDPSTAFTGTYGFRVVDIDLGWLMDDGSYVYEDTAGFYIIRPNPKADGDSHQADIEFELVDMYFRATTTKVDEGWKPLDGLTPAEARNYVLGKMGLPPSRGDWYVSGAPNLPNGLPDEPIWWPKPGQTAADIFEALDFFEWTETYVRDDLTWSSRPKRYTDNAVSFTFDGVGADPTRRIEKINNFNEYRELKTAYIVSGKDERDGSFWATSINYNIERDPALTGFVGWRIWERQDNKKLLSVADALVAANKLRTLQQVVPELPEIQVPGEPTVKRGKRCKCTNVTMAGGANTNEYRIEEIEHQWRPSRTETKSNLKLRRVL